MTSFNMLKEKEVEIMNFKTCLGSLLKRRNYGMGEEETKGIVFAFDNKLRIKIGFIIISKTC